MGLLQAMASFMTFGDPSNKLDNTITSEAFMYFGISSWLIFTK